MIRPEIEVRLARMVAEDPRGKEAATLLRRMVAFYGPFNRYLMMTLAPKEMSRQARMGTLRTLHKWGFLVQRFQSNHWRYQPERFLFLNPVVLEAIDVDQNIYHILFKRSQEPVPDHDPLRAYQLVYRPEWLRALREAFHRNRDQGLRFFLSLSPFKIGERSAQNTAIEIRQRYPDTEEQIQALLYFAVLCEEYDLPWMFYGYFNPFTERSQDAKPLQTFLEQNAILSLSQENKEVIQQIYERNAANVARQEGSKVFFRLGAIKLTQSNVQEALGYFDRAIAAHSNRQLGSTPPPLKIAQMLEALSKPEIARFIYSRLYLLRRRVDELWYWGHMEYRLGAHEDGIGLCRMALYKWRVWFEEYKDMRASTHMRRDQKLEREWQRKYDELLVMEYQEANRSTPID